MNKFEIQRMMLESQHGAVQQEVQQWLELIRNEAVRRLEDGAVVVSVSSFVDMTQRLSDAVTRRDSINAQLQLLNTLWFNQ